MCHRTAQTVVCVVDDFWFRYVAEWALPGLTRARAAGTCSSARLRRRGPRRYYVYRPPTFTNWVVFRALGGARHQGNEGLLPLGRS